jgi:hypothetical protein
LKLQFSYRKYNHQGLCCQVKSPESKNLGSKFGVKSTFDF